MARRATYIPLSHDDYDLALVQGTRRPSGGPRRLDNPETRSNVIAWLLAGLPVRDVSQRLGFLPPNFYAAFKREFGKTPGQWLAEQRAAASANASEPAPISL